MKDVIFKGTSFHDYNEWSKTDKQVFKRIFQLIEVPEGIRLKDWVTPNH